jgi:hypothetical protein
MARPKKTGLDYFPKDTDCLSDRKVRRLLSDFGGNGYMVFDYLLCLIYQDKGYFLKCDNDLAFDVADFLQNGITEELVKDIIKKCVLIGLFDEEKFNTKNILTSMGIQKRYSLAKKTGVISEENRVINEETKVNKEETPINNIIIPQSKVKESKVNKSKVKESKEELAPELEYDYMIGNDEILSIHEIFKEKFLTLYNTVCGQYGELKIKKWTDDFANLHKQKTWKDYQDFRGHLSNYFTIRNLKDNDSTKNGFNGNKKGIGTTIPTNEGKPGGKL